MKLSIWSLHWTTAKTVTDGSLQDSPASSCTIHVPLPCCHPGSPSLTVLHVTTRHFTSLMLLIFSSISSFFTSGWKYCSCSSASACGGTQKRLWGEKDERSRSINGLRANYYRACLKQTAVWEPGSQRNTKYLLLKNIHIVHMLCFSNNELSHLWDVWVGGFNNSMYYWNKHIPTRTVQGEVR